MFCPLILDDAVTLRQCTFEVAKRSVTRIFELAKMLTARISEPNTVRLPMTSKSSLTVISLTSSFPVTMRSPITDMFDCTVNAPVMMVLDNVEFPRTSRRALSSIIKPFDIVTVLKSIRGAYFARISSPMRIL